MNLLYFYPPRDDAGPPSVARSLMRGLLKKRRDLPGQLWVTGPRSVAQEVEQLGADFVEWRSLSSQKVGRSLVHIPISPWIALNSRFFLQLLSWISQARTVVNYHGDFLVENAFLLANRRWIKALGASPSAIAEPALLRWNDRVVVNSVTMQELLYARHSLPEEKVAVIPNGLDSWWLEKGRVQSEDQHSGTIAFHGRIAREKGVIELIRAFARVYESGIGKKLVILGSGPARKRVARLARTLGCIDAVRLPGQVPREELLSVLKKASCCVYPSLYEPFSLSALEAIAVSGGPVCVSNRAGVLEFVKDTPGVIEMEPTVEDIARAIEEALAVPTPHGWTAVRRSSLLHLTWGAIASKYVSLYNEVLSQSN